MASSAGGDTVSACSTTGLFSSISPRHILAQLLLYSVQKASWPRGKPEPVEELQNQACGLLLPPPAPAEGRGAVKLLDARNECGLLPSMLCFPPSGNALVWASLFLII